MSEIFGNRTGGLIPFFRKDEYGNIVSERIEPVEYYVFDSTVSMREAPDLLHNFQVEHDGNLMYRVSKPNSTLQENEYRIDEYGFITFNPAMNGKKVSVSHYYGRGSWKINPENVLIVDEDGSINANRTLLTFAKELREYIKFINQYEYIDEWQEDTSYLMNNQVMFNGSTYVARKGVPENIPPTDSEHWRVFASGIGECDFWQSGKRYFARDTVINADNSIIYICKYEHVSSTNINNDIDKWQILIDVSALLEAEAIRIETENRRIEDENERNDNENVRIANENIRMSSENDRISEEESRINNELNRVFNENQRIADESVRLDNETSRVANESDRQTLEAVRISNESSRESNEVQRIANETQRNVDEVQRISNEAGRVSAENTRLYSENERIAKENSRIAAENQRAEDEHDRIANEGTRMSAENIRVIAENARITSENNRITAENQRISQESARLTAEEIRSTNESGRQNSEVERIANEASRELNESIRSINEELRVTKEDIRKTNEEERISNEGYRIEQFDMIVEEAHEAAEYAKEQGDYAQLVAESIVEDVSNKADDLQYCPVTGVRTSIQTILFNIFNAFTPNSISATDFDNRDITVDEFDALDISVLDFNMRARQILQEGG